MKRILQVRKRDGRLVPFDRSKIADAIFRAARAVGGEDRFLAEELAGVVVLHLERRADTTPKIEDIQDAVEKLLIETGHARTAKAFILYRERRSAARAARRAADAGAGLLFGGEGGEEAVRWSKARIVEALVEADDLPRPEAEDVARAVEERVLRSGVPRVSGRLVHALVQAEMLERGCETRLAEAPRGGVRWERVAAWLDRGPSDRRAADPAAFAEALGEAALEAYVLGEVLPPATAEAHRRGDLHAYDLGAPLGLTALALPALRLLERHLDGTSASRAGGPRRFAAWMGATIRRHRPYATRLLALEAFNVLWAPFVSHLDEDALAAEARELLRTPEVAAFPHRGGLLELELGLVAEVPARLAARPVPSPAPPGRTYADFADVAREAGRALLREVAQLRRQGLPGGPRFTLVLPRDGPRDASARALVREALRSAAEVGEPLVVFEDAENPTRGSRWFRLSEADAPDPLRFAGGDVSAATTTGLNLVGAALRAGRGNTEGFFGDVEQHVRTALDGAVARRLLLERSGEEPGRTLYPLRRGPVPLVDLDAAVHILEPVGLERALRHLEPSRGEAWRQSTRARLLAHLHERAGLEAEARGLQAAVSEGLSGEAGARFARLDAARFGEAATWWVPGAVPTYAAPPPKPGEAVREPTLTERRRGARSFQRVRHRVSPEGRPEVGDLMKALDAAAHDALVVEYALEPWPLRLLRTRPSSG